MNDSQRKIISDAESAIEDRIDKERDRSSVLMYRALVHIFAEHGDYHNHTIRIRSGMGAAEFSIVRGAPDFKKDIWGKKVEGLDAYRERIGKMPEEFWKKHPLGVYRNRESDSRWERAIAAVELSHWEDVLSDVPESLCACLHGAVLTGPMLGMCPYAKKHGIKPEEVLGWTTKED